jgi:thioredoxin reductase (NADPH)
MVINNNSIKNCDVAIIGIGPSGMQAAIHASRKNVSVYVFGKIEESNSFNAKIENFFGFQKEISGKKLLQNSQILAEKFGVKFFYKSILAVKFYDDNKSFVLTLDNNEKIFAKSIVIATGIKRKKLSIKNENEYLGKGVSYCVDCDGLFFKNKIVTITGNEANAVFGALSLAEYTKKVYLVFTENLEMKIDDNLKKLLKSHENIKISQNQKIIEINGDGYILKNIVLDSREIIETDGLFIEFGSKGALEIFAFSDFGIELDETLQHIKVNQNHETNIKGVWAVGDIAGQPYQIAKAIGDGCKTGINAANYVKNLEKYFTNL